jgi:hypothetical protein
MDLNSLYHLGLALAYAVAAVRRFIDRDYYETGKNAAISVLSLSIAFFVLYPSILVEFPSVI